MLWLSGEDWSPVSPDWGGGGLGVGALNATEDFGEPQKIPGRRRRWELLALGRSLVGRQEDGEWPVLHSVSVVPFCIPGAQQLSDHETLIE